MIRYHNALYRPAYIQKNLSWLKSFLTMSDADKGRDLAQRYIDDFITWLDLSGVDEDEPITSDGLTLQDVTDTSDLSSLYDDTAEAFFAHMTSKHDPDETSPSYLFFDYVQTVKNQWLIHFTNAATDVASEGFSVGMSDLARLGLTIYYDAEEKVGGYNFAYTIDAFDQYGHGNPLYCGTDPEHNWCYGNQAVLFQASGLELWHRFDNAREVIFWGSDARNRVALVAEGNRWVAKSCEGESVHVTDRLSSLVDWTIANFDQYRRQLVCGK